MISSSWMLMGYRMLLLRNPDPKALDKETLKRSRDAYDKLESLLRHGGVKSQDGGERVYTINNEEKLSLQEVLPLRLRRPRTGPPGKAIGKRPAPGGKRITQSRPP